MPRRSVASRSVIPPITAPRPRPEPPADLTPGQLQVWRIVTGSLPDGFYSPDAGPLLASFCRHVARVNEIEAALAKLNPSDDTYAPLARLATATSQHVALLSRLLRIAPNARMRPDVARHRADRGGIGITSVDALFARRAQTEGDKLDG